MGLKLIPPLRGLSTFGFHHIGCRLMFIEYTLSRLESCSINFVYVNIKRKILMCISLESARYFDIEHRPIKKIINKK